MEDQRERMHTLFANSKFPGTDFTIFQLAMLPYAQPALACDKHIKMACMGFLGECLRRFPDLTVIPAVEQVGSILADCSNDDDLCNDCCWFLGETSLVLCPPLVDTEQATKIVGVMANKLVPLLAEGQYHPNLLQNCAIAIGRFGLMQPQLMASQLASFITPLCMNLSLVRDTSEKEQGFLGVCRMLQHGGFSALEDSTILHAVLCGFSSFKERSGDVTTSFIAILSALKKAIPQEEWGTVRQLLPGNFPLDQQRHM